MKESQLNWVIKQLKENGQVSRNDALRHYLTRLSARILDLKESGWEFEVEREGGDYVYRVVHIPSPEQLVLIPR